MARVVPPVINRWLKRIARRARISQDAAIPLLSEEEFRSLERVVLSPREGLDAVARFAKNFARYVGVRYGVGVNSGTSALEIAVAAAGIGPGDEVIVPSYSFYSTASAVLKARAKLVFVDARLEDGCIDCEEVYKAVTAKTKAVIAVHLGGVPADLDALVGVCRERGLTLIEDVAQAVGSEWRSRKLGSFGAMGCFSFQASKNLAVGEGGFIATNDKRLFFLCSALSNVGLSPEANEWEHVLLGGNYRLPHLEAAVLSILLEKVDEPIQRKEENSAFLTDSLKKIPGIIPFHRPSQATRINHHFYGLRYDSGKFGGMPKEKFVSLLQAKGLPCGEGYPIPLYAHPAFNQNLESLQPVQIPHPNTLKLCAEVAGFEQNFLLAARKDMEKAVEAIQRVAAQYNGSRSR